ncbi:MAG: prolyl oligopeptidase family serine peptidase [Vicinamibacterales bacterium]
MRRLAPAASLGLALALLLAPPADARQRRAPTLDDLLDMVQVSGGAISPDGRQVIYSRSVLAPWEENKRVTTVWIANADGTGDRQLLGSDKDRSPAWSPDGRWVAFLSTRDQAAGARAAGDDDAAGAQIWLLPTSGGEATKLTTLDAAVRAFAWTPDSRQIALVAEEPRTEAEKKAAKALGDAIDVDDGANGQGRGRFSNVWIATLADKSARRVTSGDHVVTAIAPSPDGSRIAYIARPNNRRNHQNLAEVYVVDAASGASTRLTTNEAPESDVKWTPDGTQVTYLTGSTAGWELAQEKLYAQPAAGGAPRLLSRGYDGDIREYFWTPGGTSVLLAGTRRGRGVLAVLDVGSGAVRDVATGDDALAIASADGARATTAGTWSAPGTPAEIVVVDVATGARTRVTDANPWFAGVETATMRPVTWKSPDGTAIEGLLWLPAGHTAGTRLPLLLSIHGGPAGVWSTSFRGINHVYASLGWAVLEPNVRGSTSYGDALLRGNIKDIGGGDYRDAMAGVDALIAQGIADPDHLAVRGWSYGGILGGWTITQTTRFKAASLGAMVTDWASEYAMGFNHDVRLWYIGGTPWENPEGYHEQSSYSHIAKVTTPTILFHGEQDDTDTIGQSMMFYQGLADRGVPSRFLRFPREPHGFREPQHIRMRDAEEIRWLMKHARGIDWEAPPRPEEKKTDTDATAAPKAATPGRR